MWLFLDSLSETLAARLAPERALAAHPFSLWPVLLIRGDLMFGGDA